MCFGLVSFNGVTSIFHFLRCMRPIPYALRPRRTIRLRGLGVLACSPSRLMELMGHGLESDGRRGIASKPKQFEAKTTAMLRQGI